MIVLGLDGKTHLRKAALTGRVRSFRANIDSRRASAREIDGRRRAHDSIDARRWHAADAFNRYRPNPDSADEMCSFSRMPQTDVVDQGLLLRTRQAEVAFRSKNVAI